MRQCFPLLHLNPNGASHQPPPQHDTSSESSQRGLIMDVDSIKSRARHASWKRDDQSKWDKYNPFCRTVSRTSLGRTQDPEANVGSGWGEGDRPPVLEKLHSTGCIDSSTQQRDPAVSGLKTANTFPETSPTDTTTTHGSSREYYANVGSDATTLNGDADNISKPAVS